MLLLILMTHAAAAAPHDSCCCLQLDTMTHYDLTYGYNGAVKNYVKATGYRTIFGPISQVRARMMRGGGVHQGHRLPHHLWPHQPGMCEDDEGGGYIKATGYRTIFGPVSQVRARLVGWLV